MATPSTRNLSQLPPPSALESLLKSVAILEAIVCPEWEYRYFSFNVDWDPAKQERMASMRNGEGDSYFAVFGPIGAILKGFAHESPMSHWSQVPPHVWPGVLDQVPQQFAPFLTEPAFSMDDTTFCIWHTHDDTMWRSGEIAFPEADDPDGSERLLWMLDGNPTTYHEFAESYYERSVELAAVEQIYAGVSLSEPLAARINPDAPWQGILTDATEIGYAVST